ncbi:MAG TPA: ATP-binding cassette domain-containing protein [Acidimicrobiales bacterium]|nr:ATP-binding cassette domain-containing protein [Acidimicrobiales bacterium]
MTGTGLVALADSHLLGGSHGHHGLRILLVVVIVAVVVVGSVKLVRRRSRARRPPEDASRAPIAPTPAPDDAAPREREQRAAAPAGPAGMRAAPLGGSAVAGTASSVGATANSIRARGLTKRFGDKVAVDGLSFDVRPGQVTGFLGPNGAGKSTTMRLIMGLDRPDAGSVSVNGRPYHDLSWPLRAVGALLEAKAIHPGRTAYAHLLMLAKTNHIPRRRVDEVLGLVGLSSVAGKRAGEFSLGMSQRLGIAAALLGDPGVLLFDEPVNGLDTDGIRWVRQLLRGLASEGRAVLVSSHLMSEMDQTADHLVVIGRGRLIADMPAAEFTARYARGFIRVRSPQLDELSIALEEAGASVSHEEGKRSISVRGMSQDTIGEIAFRHSIMLHELAPQAASLEEAFVESTEADVEFGGHREMPAPGAAEGGA